LRIIAFVGLAAALAGCGRGDTVIDRTFDVCAPIALDPQNASADQQGGIEDAIALWRDHGITTLTAEMPADAQSLAIVFQEANPTFHGYYDDENGVIYVNVALDADPEARAITIAHELGHAFGLHHVDADERVSLMNPHNLTVAPTDEDARQVQLLWGPCMP
jgi:hypothetical protein